MAYAIPRPAPGYPRGPLKGLPPPVPPVATNNVGAGNPIANQYKLYNSAVGQQAEDYGDIMGGYRSLIANTQNNPTKGLLQTQRYNPQQLAAPQTISPQTHQYKSTADVTSSIGNLKELSRTGGYSDEMVRDLRARGISPIRSVYANAERDMNRNRAIQGGYSPNFNAAQAKMARELSETMAGQVTNVNAGIAENIAKGRLGIAGQYNSASERESENINASGRENANIVNETNRFNAGNVNRINEANAGQRNEAMRFNIGNEQDMLKFNETLRSGDQNRIQQALQGMTSMYGTTPAMSKLFGDQALSAAEVASRNKRQAEEMMLRGARV